MNISFDEFSSPTSRHIKLNHDWHDVRRMNNIGRIRQEEEEMTIFAVHHDGINSIFQAHSIPRARASRTTSRYAARTSSISETNKNVSITIDSATTQSILKAVYDVLDSKFEK